MVFRLTKITANAITLALVSAALYFNQGVIASDSPINLPAGYKIGVGTSSPQADLDVGGGTASSIDGTNDVLVKDDLEVNQNIYSDNASGTINLQDVTFSSKVQIPKSASNGYVMTSNANGDGSWQASASSGSEWSDQGQYLYPSDLSGAEDIVFAGTSDSVAKNIFNANGSALLNKQNSSNFYWRVESDDHPSAFFANGETGQIGIMTSETTASLTINGSMRFVTNAAIIHSNNGLSSSDINHTDLRFSSCTDFITSNSANPQIPDGYDGQILHLTSTTGSDETFIHGNGLALSGGSDVTLRAGDSLTLIYVAIYDRWIEVSRSNNNACGVPMLNGENPVCP